MNKRQQIFLLQPMCMNYRDHTFIDKYSLKQKMPTSTQSSVALNVCSSVSMKQVLTFIAIKINYI